MLNLSELEDYFYVMGMDLLETGLSSLAGLAGYILIAVGLYTIAKRRGIRNPWLAWVPFGQSWMLGCVSDQYQHVAKGRRKNKRTALLWLDIISTVLGVISVVLLIEAFVELFRYVDINNFSLYDEYLYLDAFDKLSDSQLMKIASAMMRVMLPGFAMMGTTLAATVLRYMALHDLYRSCEQSASTATVYTVVSIFFGNIATGVLVLLYRNKDMGMRPPQYYGNGQGGYLPPQQNWQPPQQPWQQPPQQNWQPPQQQWNQPPQQPQDPWQNNNQQW